MTHICHVSVLNPLRHSRIFYRWGLACQKLGYRVSIVAQGGTKELEDSGIRLIGTGTFSRLSPERFFFSFFQRKKILQTQADIYVLHSPELLGLGNWLKNKSGAKIIYDAHEDYYQNIIHATHYPTFFRKPLANFVRNQEQKSLAFLDAVVYAEECYEGMLPLEEGKRFFVRNTFTSPPLPLSPTRYVEKPYMLTTGTLAWAWGLKESLELWKAINRQKPLHWVVAGHTNDLSILQFLKKEAKGEGLEDNLTIFGGQEYLEYDTIVRLIQFAEFGTGFYHPLPHIKEKIPTKFYEFMALGRPLLFPKENAWEIFNQQNPFGIPVDLGAWQEPRYVEKLLDQIKRWKPAEDAKKKGSFESEIPTLKSMLEGLYH